MFNNKIAIDLGTDNTKAYIPGKGIILNEPTILVSSLETKEILAVGSEAFEMIGKTPELIVATKPIKNGVIADYNLTVKLIKHCMNKTLGTIRLRKPELMITVPVGITSTEKRAVIEAGQKAGAKNTYIIQEPIAAALGGDIPIAKAKGNLIVCIGAGVTQVALISLGGIVKKNSIRIGSKEFDFAIQDYIKKKYKLIIGGTEARYIKEVLLSSKKRKYEVSGIDLASGLPARQNIAIDEFNEILLPLIDVIVLAIRNVLEQTPPELASDILENGIIFSGGGSKLKRLTDVISEVLNLPAFVLKNPEDLVILGAGYAIENIGDYKRAIISK